jgi:hypothetical protein
MKLAALVLLVALGLNALPAAQRLAVEFSPSFAGFPNQTLKIHDATGNGFTMNSPCGDIAIFVGSQTGPLVPNNPTCGPGFTVVPAYGTFTYSWQMLDPAGNLWPEGDYWYRIRVNNPLGGQIEEWFCTRWQNSGPHLGVGGAIRVGQSTSLVIDNGPASGFYWVVVSRTQATPFSLFGQNFCLSPDGVFFSSVTNPASLMTNSFGSLDASGMVLPTLNVPPLSTLQYQGAVLQALTIDLAGTGAYGTTNPVSFRILP